MFVVKTLGILGFLKSKEKLFTVRRKDERVFFREIKTYWFELFFFEEIKNWHLKRPLLIIKLKVIDTMEITGNFSVGNHLLHANILKFKRGRIYVIENRRSFTLFVGKLRNKLL